MEQLIERCGGTAVVLEKRPPLLLGKIGTPALKPRLDNLGRNGADTLAGGLASRADDFAAGSWRRRTGLRIRPVLV